MELLSSILFEPIGEVEEAPVVGTVTGKNFPRRFTILRLIKKNGRSEFSILLQEVDEKVILCSRDVMWISQYDLTIEIASSAVFKFVGFMSLRHSIGSQ